MKKNIVFTLILLLSLYLVWKRIASPYGSQIVNYTPATRECFKEPGFSYCIYKSCEGTNLNIAYHLHGRNLDENSWNDDTFYTAMVQKYWQNHKIKPPIVVSVSFGPQWILTPYGSAQKSGLLDVFLKTAIPAIESKTGAPKERILFGESMGGLNSLIAGLSYSSVFNRVAALCPGVYQVDPFSSWREIFETVKRTGADPKIVLGVLNFSKKFIHTKAEWDRVAPLNLAGHVAPGNTKFYLSCGLYDVYGNFEGTERLAQTLRGKGYKIEWHPIYGGHCSTDVSTLAEFLGR